MSFNVKNVERFNVYFFVLVNVARSTIDVNFPEYQYLADHLTESECHELVTALHFESFELPRELSAAEKRLPKDVSCIDLLLHLNSSPGEGRGKTHVEICHRLNQIGRRDLADWLTRTVFHQLSNDLKNFLKSSKVVNATERRSETEFSVEEEIFIDEAAWWKLDTFLSIVIVIGALTLLFGIFFYCYLRIERNTKMSN